MMRNSRHQIASGESGAVAVVSAITLTILLLFAAFVIDLGFLRADRATGQSVSDMAAAAAVQAYEPRLPGSARDACLQALEYAEANLAEVPQFTPPLTAVNLGCAVFPATDVCEPGDAKKTAVYESLPFTLKISNPVPDLDPALMDDASYGPEIDGLPCDRFGVELHRTRGFHLAAAGGSDRPSGTTNMSAVARASIGTDGEYASLIVLDRLGCRTLRVSGQASIHVQRWVDPVTGDVYPGIISVDTTPDSCNPMSSPVIRVSPSGSAYIWADDYLFSYGLLQGAPEEQIYTESDTVPPPTPPRLVPRPDPGRQITRSPVDHLFNCLADYDGANANFRWSPSHADSIGAIDGCDEGTTPYIKELYAALGDLASPGNNQANPPQVAALHTAGWSVFPNDFPGQSCNSASGTYGPGDDHNAAVGDGTKFYINCRPGGQSLAPQGLSFVDVRTIVSRNEVTLTGSDVWDIDGPSDTGTVLFFQRGGADLSGGTLNWRDTFVYIENDFIDMSGDGSITWHAPTGATADSCVGFASGIPPAGCFSPLALWSNALTTNPSQENTMGGQASLNLVGSFFTPNATFNLGGLSPYTLDKAQFFAARINTSGQGTIGMTAFPELIETPLTGRGLIR